MYIAENGLEMVEFWAFFHLQILGNTLYVKILKFGWIFLWNAIKQTYFWRFLALWNHRAPGLRQNRTCFCDLISSCLATAKMSSWFVRVDILPYSQPQGWWNQYNFGWENFFLWLQFSSEMSPPKIDKKYKNSVQRGSDTPEPNRFRDWLLLE